MQHRVRTFALTTSLCVLIVLAGCAAPARHDAMTTPVEPTVAVGIPAALKGQIAIKDVVGGKHTNPLVTSQVSSSDFEAALEASLRNYGLAAPGRQSGRYLLAATIQRMEQPFLGLSMTVTTTVNYDLIERATNKTAWTRTITRPYTAKATDAFLGSERLRLANEGSVKVNIEALIEELSRWGTGS